MLTFVAGILLQQFSEDAENVEEDEEKKEEEEKK